MKRVSFFFCFSVSSIFSACPAPSGPTAQEGAAYLGLEDGTTFSYAAGEALEETHEVKSSGILFEGVAVDRFARQNGFAEDARTLSFGVDVAGVSLLRFFDCLAKCGTLDAPIPFLEWPLEEGQNVEGEAVVTVAEGDTNVVHNERHSTLVSGPVSVSVPAGDFDDAFLIAWSRTTTDAGGAEEVDTAQLHFVPELGFVRWEDFDATILELNAEP